MAFVNLRFRDFVAACLRCSGDNARVGRLSALTWIIAFKAFKTIALTAAGVTLVAGRRGDPADLLMRLALVVHLPLTSRVFERAMDMALRLTAPSETALAIAAFGYAALMGTEGVGLYRRRAWARWFTMIVTSSFVPIEVYEIVRAPHVGRVLILLANVAIVVYLWRREEIFDGDS